MTSDSPVQRQFDELERGLEALYAGIQYPYYGAGPEEYGDSFYPYPAMANVPPAFLLNQKRGESLPYYLNWNQLRTIRDRIRLLCSTNEFAISAIVNLQSFIIGSGFTYRALPAHDEQDPDDELLKRVQRVIDIFVGANRLNQIIEPETIMRDCRDGETFLRLFYRDNGLLQVRFVEPEHVYPPEGDADPKNSFGIESNPKDIASVRGYYIVEDPLHEGWMTKYVKAKDVVHSKCNTDSGSKRGLPLFYPVEGNLKRAEDILAALSSSTKSRAKIALIRHIEGASKSKAEALKAELETGQTFDPTTGGVTNTEQLKNSTVLTSSKNISYEFPQLGAGADSGITVLQAELRAVAARLVMPEVMLTADASNGTYSSQLVAEAPATRNFQRLQRYYQNMFGESRAPGHESLIWRQIAHAVACGLLDEKALTDVKVIAQAPAIIPRDPDKAAAATKTYFDMGALSIHNVCAEIGVDYDAVRRERKAEGLPENPVDAMNAQAGVPAPGAEAPPEEDQPGEDVEFDSAEFGDF